MQQDMNQMIPELSEKVKYLHAKIYPTDQPLQFPELCYALKGSME
jgi:hypothetical protein